MPSREYYLNSDFDLSLRGRPSLLETGNSTFVHEMAWHFLFAASSRDSLIVHRPLPADFLEYVAEKGLALPRIVVDPGYTPESEFTPFGWNVQVEKLAGRYLNPSAHPDPGIVKTANSRAFGLGLEREWLESGSPGGYGTLFASLPELETFIAGRQEPEGWVIKGDHGHAGTANRRVPSGPVTEADRIALARLMEEHGQVVAEAWDRRLMDLAVNFTVEKGGGVSDFRGHQLLNSRDGAFLGVKLAPSRLPPEPWRDALSASAAAAAKALDAIGYFGPVSVDAYVFETPVGPRLRPLVDINARHSMAMPAYGLAGRLPGKALLWTWSKPRKLSLPEDYHTLDQRLGPHAFQASTGEGIMAVSPISLPGEPRRSGGASSGVVRPKRVGFLFSARDEAGLESLRSAFNQALGRP